MFRIEVTSTLGRGCLNQVIQGHHLPDMEIFLTPDLYGKLQPGSYPDPSFDKKAACNFYLNQLKQSGSNCDNCRSYVAYSYYHNVQKCFPNAYWVDALSIHEGENRLFRVVTKDENLNQVVEQTTIQLQRFENALWKRVKDLSTPIVT